MPSEFLAPQGARWVLEFTDELGDIKTAWIIQDGYTGSITSVKGAGLSPLFISMQSQGDEKFETLKPTEIELNVYAQTDFEFNDIADSDEREFSILVQKNGANRHFGYILPEVYSEPYVDTPYPVTLRAVTLGALKNLPYRVPAATPQTSIFLESVIAQCLSPLRRSGDPAGEFKIFESINVESTDALARVLESIRIDERNFLNDEGEFISRYDALEKVLKPFGVNLFMDDGRFVIVPYELRVGTRPANVYGGIFFGYEQTVSIATTANTGRRAIGQNQVFSRRPAFRRFDSIYAHGVSRQVAINGDFNEFRDIPNSVGGVFARVPVGWDTIDFDGLLSNQVGEAFIDEAFGGPSAVLFPTNSFAGGITTTQSYTRNSADDTFTIKLRYAVFRDGFPTSFVRFIVRTPNFWLRSDGSWQGSSNTIEIEDENRFFTVTPFSYGDFNLTTEPIPENGNVTVQILVSGTRSAYPFFQINANPEGRPQVEENVLIALNEVESYSDVQEQTIEFGDGPTSLHPSAFQVNTPGQLTSEWTRTIPGGGATATGTIQELYVNAVMRQYESPTPVIQGTYRMNQPNLFDLGISEQGGIYTMNAGSFDERRCYMDGQFLRVSAGLRNVDPIFVPAPPPLVTNPVRATGNTGELVRFLPKDAVVEDGGDDGTLSKRIRTFNDAGKMAKIATVPPGSVDVSSNLVSPPMEFPDNPIVILEGNNINYRVRPEIKEPGHQVTFINVRGRVITLELATSPFPFGPLEVEIELLEAVTIAYVPSVAEGWLVTSIAKAPYF